jgi:acyl-coenzyme A synthetase/AMP-(fatty) acid ligase
VLLSHEDVADAAVVAKLHRTIDPQELQEFFRARLRSAKTPDRIEIWDDLPRTETGKLLRRDVLARIVTST